MPIPAPLKPLAQAKNSATGFTLLEAVLVIAVLAVLLGLTAPAMTGWQARHRVQAQAESLLDSLVLARSEALRRQHRVTLCARSQEGLCDPDGQWQQGWLVFVDANHNGLRDSGEVLLDTREALPKGMQVGVSLTVKTYYAYNAEGRSATVQGAFMAGTWRFCVGSSSRAWRVVANALGKPRIESYTTEQCP